MNPNYPGSTQGQMPPTGYGAPGMNPGQMRPPGPGAMNNPGGESLLIGEVFSIPCSTSFIFISKS